MRNAAISVLIGLAVSLAGCDGREPDFSTDQTSPAGNFSAHIRAYESSGTIAAKLFVYFSNSKKDNFDHRMVFRRINNSEIGWVSEGKFAIVGEHIRYVKISSRYYITPSSDPINVVICDNIVSDCRSLSIQIRRKVRLKPEFPGTGIVGPVNYDEY